MRPIRLPDDLADRLSAVGKAEGRSPDALVADAVRSYLDKNDSAYRTEAQRQSKAVAAQGSGQEDRFWESASTFDTAEPPATNAAE